MATLAAKDAENYGLAAREAAVLRDAALAQAVRRIRVRSTGPAAALKGNQPEQARQLSIVAVARLLVGAARRPRLS
jgi:hypothetical protein